MTRLRSYSYYEWRDSDENPFRYAPDNVKCFVDDGLRAAFKAGMKFQRTRLHPTKEEARNIFDDSDA